MLVNLHAIDIALIVLYFLALLGLGSWMAKRTKTREDFLVGGRNVPMLAVLGSLVATEVSAATFLAVPGVGFSENLAYLQFGIGSLLARFFLAAVFLKAFFASNYLSIYEYLGERFGRKTQRAASLYFLATRLLASGVRLMIAVTGVSLILGIPFLPTLLVFLLMTFAYTAAGGIRSVIWTDCLQAVVFLGAGIAAFLFLLFDLGWETLVETGSEAGRWQVLVLKAEAGKAWYNQGNWWLTAILFGFLSTTASLGTDQDLAQRLLASKNRKAAGRSLILSGFVALPVAALFLILGVALFASQTVSPDPGFPMKVVDGQAIADGDKAFSWFISTLEVPGLSGLLLVGVLAAAMSSLDSAMAAMSGSAATDLGVGKGGEDRPGASRWLVPVFGMFLGLIAWSLQDAGTFLWLAFKITALTYGPLLGLFLLGLLTRRGRDERNLGAMMISTLVCLAFLVGMETGMVPLAWTWLLPLGAVLTIALAWRAPAE